MGFRITLTPNEIVDTTKPGQVAGKFRPKNDWRVLTFNAFGWINDYLHVLTSVCVA
jgi:hypothetical protein